MTKEEFVKRVMAIIESGELDKLEELYEEVLRKRDGGDKVTVVWGTR